MELGMDAVGCSVWRLPGGSCSTFKARQSLSKFVNQYCNFFPQQRKLMGSLAQNSSGVRWCRGRVRFNEVPESSEGSGEGLRGFGAEPGQVQQGSEKVPEKVWEALVQSQVRFIVRLW